MLIINESVVKCRPLDYQIAVALLRHSYRSLAQLETELYGKPNSASYCKQLRKSISRLRPKLWSVGLDICCLHTQGYLLVDAYTMLPLPFKHETTDASTHGDEKA